MAPPPARMARAAQAPGLVVAQVVSVEEHPKADKLRVVEVDAGVATYKVRPDAPGGMRGGRGDGECRG
jgi:predicted RNA-binding protein with EMAP domain